MSSAKKNWFRIRKMGWIPCSWQGWAALVIYMTLMMFALDLQKPSVRRMCGAGLTVGLIGVAMWKSGPRRTTNE